MRDMCRIWSGHGGAEGEKAHNVVTVTMKILYML